MNEEYYIQLIHKQLTGDISAEEQDILDAYVDSDPQAYKLIEEVEIAWQLSQNPTIVPEVDVNQELSKLRSKLKLENKPHRIVPIRRWLSIAAAVLVLVATSLWVINDDAWLGSNDTVIMAEGGAKQVTLPDGSSVWLKQGSRITYADQFGMEHRSLAMEGTVFYDVQRMENLPFVIDAGHSSVEVLGTSFEIVQGTQATELHVYTGRVSFSSSGAEKLLIKGQSAQYSDESQSIVSIEHKEVEDLIWKTGRFVFRDIPLEQVVERIAQYNQIRISLENENLSKCPVNAVMQSTSSKDVLNRLGRSFEMEVVKIDDSSYALKGGRCK